MDLEYYLSCKNKYDSIIDNIKNIIENYNDIFSLTCKLDIDDGEYMLDKFTPNELKNEFKSKLNYAEYCRDFCQKQIKQLCAHELVNDMIDISPDRSQNITYCKVCEYTVPN
jgi:hypothetical protein